LLIWLVSVLIFVGCEVLPGDVAQVALGQSATAENVRALRTEFGLDRPALTRYADWLQGIVFHADWGRSITTRTPVSAMLAERLSNTLLLAGVTTLIAVPLALLIGLTMAIRSGSNYDRAASVAILGLAATPEFLIGTIAVLVFAVKLHWLPSTSYLSEGSGLTATARAILLPVGTLVIIATAQIARMTRAIVGNVLALPYIEMARLKGLAGARVVLVHALRNAIGPLANVIALNVAYLVSGVVVVETIFAYPGLARLMADSVQARDLPVVQACAMIFCATYIMLIVAADIIAYACDPKSGSQGRSA